ncbi:3-phosphoshikimate 1-carboxyvinyltransferase [Entomobacter blattae]|uniref:3-phosphoshikimate 1-carboxyvinyltransferase n=1 Tax=Entomobacter blattae TaxID=2762277 RepID=A0A7H1NTI4_9PROT|nr:3-phosphoshikimate 1-carboxyvinyltransferase [Entomobacter blattae]QNT79094.1 3-phosphoshikimate 1-carboxyvinyltransferase [Entomobacter blattae]
MLHSSYQAQPLTVHRLKQPLKGVVSLPGDKSISHRSLMLASLAKGVTHVHGLLEGEDVIRTAEAMKAMGAIIERKSEGEWVIEGRGMQGLQEPADILDMGNSGTAARLLSGLLASSPFTSVMTGDASLRKRPMMRVIAPLSGLGATFLYREGGRLPVAIRGVGNPSPITYRLPVASAQVKSAIILAGLNCVGETVVEEPVVTRDHTENMLRHFGVPVEVIPQEGGGRIIRLKGKAHLTAKDILVPGDPSSAAFVVVAALLVPGSEVTLKTVGLNPLRTGIFQTLLEMGAQIESVGEATEGGEKTGTLVVKASNLHGVEVPESRVPSMVDEFPILSVAAACARGTSRFRGLAELRVKESDRLSSTFEMLKVNGVEVHIEGDDLIIEGREGPLPGGGKIETHMDHRLAMSASILGLVSESSVFIDDTGFINTSFPGYFTLMNGLGAGFAL